MTELDGSRSLEEAEKVYFSYRRRVDEGEPVDFDAFCEAHATIADDLRFLHSALSGGSTIDLGASLSKVAAEILGDRSIEGMLASLAPFRARPGEVSENDGLGVDPGDRYRILGEVGRGGMSRILRVEDRELGRTVAMKIAYDARAPRGQGRAATASGSSLERLVAEAYVTARLEHPGIIPVYDCGLSRNGAAYYTMRLVKGRDFRVAIELARASSKDFSFERALEVLARVCEAVAFAHAKGVIHRDLKPNNIMVGAFGEAYVLDWGLAKIIGAKDRHAARMRFGGDVSLTTVATRASGRESDDPEDPLVTPAGTILGTPVFMPPEQAKGDVERINPSSDVYALGAILYTLLAGRPPYVPENGRASPLAILGEIAERPPQPIGEIDPSAPKALIAVAEKAMARRQEDRFESALELKEAIEAAGSAGRLRPRAALAATGGAAPRPGSRTLLASGALLLAGFLAIASLVLLSRRSDPDALDSRALVSLQTLRDLETDALELVPASTESLPRLENWLARARVWIERTGELRVESARAGGEATRDNVASTSVSRALAALEAFSAPDGYLARVEERLVFAREVRRRTIDEAWELWQKAIASISDRERSPSYDGLTISPQEGLLPLGPDPHSGLWEFGHLATGRVPERGSNGALEIDRHTGLVLVLLPGDAAERPFFLAKREITNAQWERARYGRASSARPDKSDATNADTPRMLVDREECERVLRDLGLELPTLAQWQRVLAMRDESSRDVHEPGRPGLERPLATWLRDGDPTGVTAARGALLERRDPRERSRDIGVRPVRILVEASGEGR